MFRKFGIMKNKKWHASVINFAEQTEYIQVDACAQKYLCELNTQNPYKCTVASVSSFTTWWISCFKYIHWYFIIDCFYFFYSNLTLYENYYKQKNHSSFLIYINITYLPYSTETYWGNCSRLQELVHHIQWKWNV